MYDGLSTVPGASSEIRIPEKPPQDRCRASVWVDWRLDPRSEENYKLQAQLFTDCVQQVKPGQAVTVADFATVKGVMMINGHHIGTARMADSAENGVVDKDLKVFGTDNLFVAGSAVWATAGIPNPTFSIITFSIRLAEYLGKSL